MYPIKITLTDDNKENTPAESVYIFYIIIDAPELLQSSTDQLDIEDQVG